MKRDWIKISIVTTVLLLMALIVIAIIFKPEIEENTLVAHILGIFEGALLVLLNFYYGTSDGSKEKTKMLNKDDKTLDGD